MNCKWHRMLRKSSDFTSIGYLALHQDEFAFEWHIEMPVLSAGIDFYFFLSCFPFSHRRFLHGCLLTSVFHEAVDLQTGAGSAHTLSPARRTVQSKAQACGL